MSFSDKQVFLFDAFGTLFKTSRIGEALKQLTGAKTESLLDTWRRKQLEYTWLRNQMNRYIPFDQITRDALDFSMRMHGLTDKRIFSLLIPIYDSPSLIQGAKLLLEQLKKK